MHFGILGMKWGYRRYQNQDGSLTPDGKKRYLKNVNSEKKELTNYANSLHKDYKVDEGLGYNWITNGKNYIQLSIPDDYKNNTSYKNLVKIAAEDIKDIDSTDFKFKKHDLGCIGTPVKTNASALVYNGKNYYSIDIKDDYDGEYIGPYTVLKSNKGWILDD